MIDLDKSIGNYVVDLDGNTVRTQLRKKAIPTWRSVCAFYSPKWTLTLVIK